jgi:type I restriction enzyme S subunit
MKTANHWQEVFLYDLADEITVGFVGPMASEYVPSGIPFLRSQDVEPYRINLNDIKYISPDFHHRLKKSTLKPGDVVIVRTGKPGTAAVIPDHLLVSNCSDVVIVRPSEQLDARFLVYYMNSSAVHHVSSHLVGAVQQHFNVSSARTLKLLLPDIKEQRAIARVLGALDDKIELNRRQNATLETLARAIFQSWFVDFDPVRARAEGRDPAAMDGATAALFPDGFDVVDGREVPRGWRFVSLDKVTENLRRNQKPEEIALTTPYIGLEHMPRKQIALEDWGYASDLESNKFAFQRGEILFGKLRPYFHKVGVAALDGVCSTDILVLRPTTPSWFGFVLGHVSSEEFVQHTDQSSDGTKMPRTRWKDMVRYQVVLPTESIASHYNRLISPSVERIIANIHQSRTLAALRDALLPRLLSGELRVRAAAEIAEGAM